MASGSIKASKQSAHVMRAALKFLEETSKDGSRTKSRSGKEALGGFKRPKVFEEMAAEKLGKEMTPDATIWELYVDEAKEYDEELVNTHQGSLDNLLLFAGLFSAILTAFLIESKNMLLPDSSEIAVDLLLRIAQSQQRWELGRPLPDGGGAIELPTFQTPKLARWINGIWKRVVNRIFVFPPTLTTRTRITATITSKKTGNMGHNSYY
ncbi:unnamed protein product [Rhizoctonia solani]|uniref:DUF6535 domain-containing protein n=1 Tax=Rhizoctonia solani TaxID=456999 RepID=A0A8H3CYE1_9AGAM|nr:unnamed protein product [Rhizoctonia solani]